ncbi:MAG: type II toxin-antitoxin system HicA family toxin [Thermodesulfovibrionales bacterium]|nr:type II toxin-antitoxin system HicA family toxin [Nitrospinota bacterium]MDP3048230.1 type II toxin-antitoxin system HicA family toxin [Thermodesulfovibrionales bacterium]
MPRLTPLHWKKLDCIFTKDGYSLHRVESSHRAYFKSGRNRPLIIPTYNSVGLDIIKGLMRSAGMTRERFFSLLAEC